MSLLAQGKLLLPGLACTATGVVHAVAYIMRVLAAGRLASPVTLVTVGCVSGGITRKWLNAVTET